MSADLLASLTALIEQARRELPYEKRRELAALLMRKVKASPSEVRLARSAAAHISWANTEDRSARTRKARAALDQKFLDMADGDPVRAAHLRKAHFAQLAAKSAATRRAKKEGKK